MFVQIKCFYLKNNSKFVKIRSIFRNKFLKNRSVNNKKTYKESSFSPGLLEKTKKDYLNLNVNGMVDDRRLYKTVKKTF